MQSNVKVFVSSRVYYANLFLSEVVTCILSWLSDIVLKNWKTTYLLFVHDQYCSCFDCRSVGTFARALDCSSSVKQPSLHMSAAAASRDITLVSLLVYTFCGLLQVYKLFLGNGFVCWRHNYYIMLSGFLENLHAS